MILLHFALLSEAQYFIEKLKLKKTNSNPKIYINDKYIVIISGIGKNNTINALKYIFLHYQIDLAFNIGIAGINNKTIPIGSLFCVNHNNLHIPYMPIISNDIPTFDTKLNKTYLFDMEAKYFYQFIRKYLPQNKIYIFKIVSDYLDTQILSKEFVKSLFVKHFIVLLQFLHIKSLK